MADNKGVKQLGDWSWLLRGRQHASQYGKTWITDEHNKDKKGKR